MKISVYEILYSLNASLHIDDIQLFNAIQKSFNMNTDEQVEVDFTNIKRCSNLFLNASFAKLYAEYGEESVKIHPSIKL